MGAHLRVGILYCTPHYYSGDTTQPEEVAVPIYEFKCVNCDTVIEKLQKVDEPFPRCKKCGWKTERMVSRNTGFRLYGNGFYKPNLPDPDGGGV